MVLITNNRRMWFVGMAVSLAIFALLYLTVIKPSSDTANQAVRTGLQQGQQALSEAQKQVGSAGGQAGTAAGQAQQQLGNAAKLTSCVAAAGANVGAVQACQAQYGK